jgi:hypothetical protein
VMRARVAPVDPSSNLQALIRSAMASATAVWQQLIQPVRDAWELWASTIVFQGPLGPYHVPGRILFTSARAFQQYLDERDLATITYVTSFPTTPGLVKLGTVKTVDGTLAETSVAVKVINSDDDDAAVYVEISPALPQTRNFWKGPWDTENADCDIIASGASQTFEFTGLEAGQRYFIRVKAVTNDSAPRFSQEYVVNQIAQTWS